jgi:hypothetical protein
MSIFALSDAAETTIVYLAIWVVIFPAVVTGLIAFAIAQSLGEKRENDAERSHPRY